MISTISLAQRCACAHCRGARPRGRAVARLRCALVLLAGLAASGAACADDAPAFDRPGIGFAPQTLPAGGVAWEQALSDATYDRSDGVHSTELVADSRVRIGLGAQAELQLAIDSQVWKRVRGTGEAFRGHGGGDASVGLKWALPSRREAFSWALLGTAAVPVGRAPYGDAGQRYDLGISAGWDLADGRNLALYANVSDSDDGHGWTVAPSYTFFARGDLSAYAEAGIGGGEDEMRALGTGVTWLIAERVQLDLSVLRGLSAPSSDWQGGVGVSVLLR